MNEGDVAAAVESAGIASAPRSWTRLGGGCIAEVHRVGLEDGGSVIVKCGPRGRAGEESSGLGVIAATNTVVVPAALAASDRGDRSLLVLEDLGDATAAVSYDWIDLGRGLADLHATDVGATFGLGFDNHLGDTPQVNRPSSVPDRWSSFLVERRLEPMRATLDGRGELDRDDHGRFDRVVARIEKVMPDAIRPALIHGDLWSGNVHPTSGRGIAVIDPAPFRADPFFEIGMMRLFGGFPSACERAHRDRLRERLGPDATEAVEFRIELGRLHHVLNHWCLFGASYAEQARRLLSELSRASP